MKNHSVVGFRFQIRSKILDFGPSTLDRFFGAGGQILAKFGESYKQYAKT
jgi:hypothetical protein